MLCVPLFFCVFFRPVQHWRVPHFLDPPSPLTRQDLLKWNSEILTTHTDMLHAHWQHKYSNNLWFGVIIPLVWLKDTKTPNTNSPLTLLLPAALRSLNCTTECTTKFIKISFLHQQLYGLFSPKFPQMQRYMCYIKPRVCYMCYIKPRMLYVPYKNENMIHMLYKTRIWWCMCYIKPRIC